MTLYKLPGSHSVYLFVRANNRFSVPFELNVIVGFAIKDQALHKIFSNNSFLLLIKYFHITVIR